MAFYTNGAIQPESRRSSSEATESASPANAVRDSSRQENEAQRALGELVERLIDGGVYPEGQNTQLFVLTSPTDKQRTLVLPQPVQNTSVDANGRRTAYTMSKRYTSSAALETGPRTTDDLLAAGG